MTKYEILKSDMTEALRRGAKLERNILADIVATIDKTAMAGKIRKEITDELVNETLVKYKKTVQEMIDTCPATSQYSTRLLEYKEKLVIVDKYAPKIITDAAEIRALISAKLGADRKFSNMGEAMKFVKSIGCDAKAAQPIVKEFI